MCWANRPDACVSLGALALHPARSGGQASPRATSDALLPFRRGAGAKSPKVGLGAGIFVEVVRADSEAGPELLSRARGVAGEEVDHGDVVVGLALPPGLVVGHGVEAVVRAELAKVHAVDGPRPFVGAEDVEVGGEDVAGVLAAAPRGEVEPQPRLGPGLTLVSEEIQAVPEEHVGWLLEFVAEALEVEPEANRSPGLGLKVEALAELPHDRVVVGLRLLAHGVVIQPSERVGLGAGPAAEGAGVKREGAAASRTDVRGRG